ncbi:MAG: acyltransferase [Opitutaceae bacterium]
MKSINRNLDQTRVLATFAVIVVHVVSIYSKGILEDFEPSWWIANFIKSSVRWCVPVFVMLSGALLLTSSNTIDNYAPFLKRRMNRVILPLVFWSIFYSGLRFTRGVDLDTLVKDLILGEPFYHMWFLFMILGLYLSLPFLASAYHYCKNKNTVLYLSILLILSTFIDEVINKFYLGNQGDQSFILSFIPYIGYLILGRLLYDSSTQTYSKLTASLLIFGSSIAATLFIFAATVSSKPELIRSIISYTSPLILLQSIFIFVLLAKVDVTSKLVSSDNMIRLSRLTLGAYLIHPFFIYFFRKLVPMPVRMEFLGMLPNFLLEFSLITLLSFITTYVFYRIQVLRKFI